MDRQRLGRRRRVRVAVAQAAGGGAAEPADAASAARREWERRHEEGDDGHWAHWRGAYPDGELPPSTWSRQSHQVAAFSFNPTLARELREAALLRRDVR